MALIVILISIGFQRFFQLNSHPYQMAGIGQYFKWMINKIEPIAKGRAWMGVALILLPLLLIVSIFNALIYTLFGVAGYFVINALLFWYCIDSRDLKKQPYHSTASGDLFMFTYQYLFAIIFWYVFFGPVGLTLYFSIISLRHYLISVSENSYPQILQLIIKIQGVLDWIPLRLLGLTYALVGHFEKTFKLIQSELTFGIQPNVEQIANWGTAAQDLGNENVDNETIMLIDRALLVWLLILAVVTIAFWVG